jgi:hypothetical protein
MQTMKHFIRFVIGIDQPHSQVSEQELALLQQYARGSNVIVELGTYEG